MSNIDWGKITKKLKVKPKSLNHTVGINVESNCFHGYTNDNIIVLTITAKLMLIILTAAASTY